MRYSHWRSKRHNRARRKGQTLALVALMIVPVLLPMAAYVVDMSYLYKRKADAQKAADAAALAGAYMLEKGRFQTPPGASTAACGGNTDTYADCKALAIAKSNGFDVNNVKVAMTGTTPWQGNDDWYHVVITSQEPVIFAGIVGFPTGKVAATATAYFAKPVTIPIDPQYYGVNTGPVTYSLFGPDSQHDNGDPFSPKLLMDGSPNPQYNPNGYNFKVKVPSNYATINGTSQVQVEIYDPDCYNPNGQSNAGANTVDELRTPTGTSPGTLANATTTQYTLIWDKDGNPDNPDANDHVQIAQQSYGAVGDTDLQWVTPPSFTFDASQYTVGSVRVNAASSAGSSENGFNLRAGPPHDTTALANNLGATSVMTEAAWHDQLSGAPGTTGQGKNGTNVAALGDLPMNFNVTGTADIILGYVPPSAANGQFSVTKFDTDVGAVSVYYTCDSLPGQTFPGVLAGDDQFVTDTITLPANYSGGNWHAFYNAGSNDTSNWSLSYGHGNGSPGRIALVQ